MHDGENRLVSVRLRADHGHFDATVGEPELFPYLGEEPGKQREKGLTARAAGYRGVLFGEQVKLTLRNQASSRPFK